MFRGLTLVLGSTDSSACCRDTERERNSAFMRDGVELFPLEDRPTAIFSSKELNSSILGKWSSCLVSELGGSLVNRQSLSARDTFRTGSGFLVSSFVSTGRVSVTLLLTG
jgi:hypothetical protein